MRALLLVSVLSAIAPSCRGGQEQAGDGKPPAKAETPEATRTTEPPAVDKPDPCGPAALGLAAARPLAPWTLPAGCTPTGGPGKQLIRSDAELRAALTCPDGVAPGVDLTKDALLVVGYTLSPAGVGLGALDDGKLVTLVSRQRNPCPNDPMPMPMNTTAWFVVPGGGERTFADKVCTVDSTCR